MPRPLTKRPKKVRAVERAVDILQSFSSDQPLMSVIELQKRVRLSRPTLYRLLDTLAAKGLIRPVGTPQRYTLDHGVAKLAHVWFSNIDASQVARPLIEQLWAETNETAALFVLRGDRRLCVMELTSRHALAISRGLGETEHIARGASGKAILAFMPPADAARLLKTAPREVDQKRLTRDLARVRDTGSAITRGEVFVGALAMAAPYFDHTGRVAGSVGLFGPEARIDDATAARYMQLVVAGAQRLSAELGHAPSMVKLGSGSGARSAAVRKTPSGSSPAARSGRG
ncbi:MAG TPA: IclR family transcriptional regulator [Alphaproteobacteria bacterium]